MVRGIFSTLYVRLASAANEICRPCMNGFIATSRSSMCCRPAAARIPARCAVPTWRALRVHRAGQESGGPAGVEDNLVKGAAASRQAMNIAFGRPETKA